MPEGMVIVTLRVKDRCPFGLVRSAEALLQEPKEVCALRMPAVAWPAVWRPCWGCR